MSEGLSTPLLMGAFWVAIVGTALLFGRLSVFAALPICLYKAGMVVGYFAWYYNVDWSVLDDVSYHHYGLRLLESGYNPVTVLLSHEGREDMITIANGYHVVYYWYNLTAMCLFGPHYYSAIFLNVIMTVVAAVYFDMILERFGYDPTYRRLVLVWFLIHPDILAWTSFVNLKDILCMTLSIINLYAVVRLLEKWQTRHLALYGFTLFVFFFLRFYVPFIIAAAVFLWIAIEGGGIRKWFLLGTYAVALWYVRARVADTVHQLSNTGILTSSVQFLLTPRPWGIDRNYTFLFIPSIAHWLMAIPAAIAGVKLWWQNHKARLILLYFMGVAAFFSMVPSLGGPRHRVQVVFVIAWLQFHFVWMVWRSVRRLDPSPLAAYAR